jgi:chromosomal replication initiation ATPase DnaA
MTPELIIRRVARHFSLDAAHLTGRSRMRHIAYARQVAEWAIRQAWPKLSLVAIGAYFGGLDHSTVLYAVEKIAAEVATDRVLAAELYAIIGLMPPRPSARDANDPIWYGVIMAVTA